jgi:hypothetical protein
MRALPVCRRSALIVFVLLVTAANAAAQRPTQVTKLRTPKVALYNCPDGSNKLREVTQQEFLEKQQQFHGPWPIDPKKEVDGSLLPVTIDGKEYCVRLYSVETDKAVTATSECGALVAANTPKSAATRGVGEGCQPNKK